MIDDIVDKLANNTALSSGERDELLTYLQQFMDTTTQINGLFGVGAYPRLSARLYSGGIIAGTGTDPDAASTTFTGTFLIYPPILLPNGDYANIGGMFNGKVMWYGNSTTGKLSAGGGNISLDYRGINYISTGSMSQLLSGSSTYFSGGLIVSDGTGTAEIRLGNHIFKTTGLERITNGDFETGDFTGWTQTGTPTISTDSPSGLYSGRVNGISNKLGQTISAVVNEYFLLSVVGKFDTSSVFINFSGFDLTSALIPGSGNWTLTYILLKATSTTPSLTFKGDSNDNFFALVDNVSIKKISTFTSYAATTGTGQGRIQSNVLPMRLIGSGMQMDYPLIVWNTGDSGWSSTPDAGFGAFYPKADKLPYFKNDSGVEMGLFGGGDGWIPDANTWSYSSGIRTQAYTNDPAAGSDIVLNVASTSGFVIGDPVTVSSSAGSENTYIVNLVANTSITVKVLALNHTTTSPLITLLEQTYVISVNADVTALIGVKDRIKLTQSTAKYFIVTAVGAFSGGATLITVFGGTDYTLANTTITSPFYSHVQNPFGFPPSPNKWTVTASTTDAPAKATPAASTWYGGNLLTPDGPILPLPIGEWRVYYKTSGDVVATLAAVAATGMRMTVSTANNSESDNELTSVVLVSLPIGTDTQRGLYTSEKSIAVTTKTPYYLNILTGNTGTTSITMNAAAIKTVFKAVCAYL